MRLYAQLHPLDGPAPPPSELRAIWQKIHEFYSSLGFDAKQAFVLSARKS